MIITLTEFDKAMFDAKNNLKKVKQILKKAAESKKEDPAEQKLLDKELEIAVKEIAKSKKLKFTKQELLQKELEIVVEENNIAIAKYLVEKKNIEPYESYVNLAIENNNLAMVKLLVGNGAFASIDKEKLSALVSFVAKNASYVSSGIAKYLSDYFESEFGRENE